MSILIKGMEMPKRCLTCQFHGFGGYKNELIVCSLTGWSEGQLSNVRGCPLIEVPTPHGRLIDADELKNWIYAWFTMHRNYHPYSKSNLIPSTEIVDIIDRLPTIIEAEEGE